MQMVWEMLCDRKILSMLGNPEQEIDQDLTRLMFIELFSRVKKLEEDNLTLRILLLEGDIVEREKFNSLRSAVKNFLQQKDEQNAAESEFFAQSGISFPEYVNFKLHGQFNH